MYASRCMFTLFVIKRKRGCGCEAHTSERRADDSPASIGVSNSYLPHFRSAVMGSFFIVPVSKIALLVFFLGNYLHLEVEIYQAALSPARLPINMFLGCSQFRCIWILTCGITTDLDRCVFFFLLKNLAIT